MLSILSYLMAATPLMPKQQRGATMVEYALIVAIISIAAITAMSTLGGNIGDFFGDANTSIEGADTGDQSAGG